MNRSSAPVTTVKTNLRPVDFTNKAAPIRPVALPAKSDAQFYRIRTHLVDFLVHYSKVVQQAVATGRQDQAPATGIVRAGFEDSSLEQAPAGKPRMSVVS